MRRALGLVVFLVTLAHAAAVGVGDRVPEVSLPDWQGGTTSLAAHRGQVVLIDFWASWCATCRTALPGVDAIARRHPGKGLVVLGIDIDGDRAAAERFLAEHLPHPALTLLRDPDGAVLARFGAAGMPALYVVDRQGIVRLAEAGYAPERLAAIEQIVDTLLVPTPPP